MRTIAELNAVRAAALKKVVLRKAGEVLAAEATSDYKYTILVCGGTGCTSSHMSPRPTSSQARPVRVFFITE